jgi:cytochrome P450
MRCAAASPDGSTRGCGHRRDRGRYSRAVTSKRTAALDALIEQATVDAYDDEEQRQGLCMAIEEHLATPFTTEVLGVEVTVTKLDLTGSGVVALCRAGQHRQAINILDLPLPTPPPEGAEWIDAYRRWAR